MLKGFDRWLTTPPDDGFDEFAEFVMNELSPEYFDKYEADITSCELNWFNKMLHEYYYNPVEGLTTYVEFAKDIERRHP